jgi:hypothetical protein
VLEEPLELALKIVVPLSSAALGSDEGSLGTDVPD